jgi:hypothetical protein
MDARLAIAYHNSRLAMLPRWFIPHVLPLTKTIAA